MNKSFSNNSRKLVAAYLISASFGFSLSVPDNSRDLGNGFFDHGVASPISSPRGVVATVDGGGRNVVLVWLFDHRGGYALLMIDAETGKSEQFPTPFRLDVPYGDVPYSSILSSKKNSIHFSIAISRSLIRSKGAKNF